MGRVTWCMLLLLVLCRSTADAQERSDRTHIPLPRSGVVGSPTRRCATPAFTGAPWPEADTLFHQDPRWLGADAAYSVSLGDGRILWLFGDTFVARSAAHLRSESRVVRNTVGIQQGDDPTRAAMTFAWRGTSVVPTSFIPEEGDRWYWPGHGIRLGRALVVFLRRMKPTPGQGLGFEVEGWRAAIVDDFAGDPLTWSVRLVAPTSAPPGIDFAGSLVRDPDGDHVLALAEHVASDHAGFLARWRTTDLAAGRVDAAEWWTEERGWVPQATLVGSPSPIVTDAGPESSMHEVERTRCWLHVRSAGFGATTIVVSEADRAQGPWSAPISVFRPPESDRAGAFVYAAKAHPELDAGDGALAVTYVANAFDFATLVSDTTLYYPRFVRLAEPQVQMGSGP